MSFNTVAVLYNDRYSDLQNDNDGRFGRAIARAMRSYASDNPHWYVDHSFGAGMVISQCHADWNQIIIVGKNSGRRIEDCNDLDFTTLERLADTLRRHGWTVHHPRPPRKPRKRKTP